MNRIFIKRSIFALIAAAVFFSCSEPQKTNNMKIEWNKLGSDGLQGDLAKGVSATYAALIDGKLVVAGGANFPGKLGFEGGSKAFYDEILHFNPADNSWKVVGRLPEPAAYGVSVSLPEGALWIGGNTATESLNSCYKISISDNNDVTLTPFIPLPVTMDNFAGCTIGNTVFVGGGNVNGAPSNAFYRVDTRNDGAWTELPPFPGLPRVQQVMAAVEVDEKSYIYLLGGFFGGDAEKEPTMATDVLRFDLSTGTWEKVGKQVDPETGQPFSLGGATAMPVPVDNRYILCLGGVNHDVFLDAIATQYKIGYDSALSNEEKEQRNRAFSAAYMTQPIDYYKFNPECRVLDTKTGEWSTLDSTPNTARAGATLVWDGPVFYAVQGELKPGVRSPETWKGKIICQ